MSSSHIAKRKFIAVSGILLVVVAATAFGWSTLVASSSASAVDRSQHRTDLTRKELTRSEVDLAEAEDVRDQAEASASTRRASRMFFEGLLGSAQSNQEEYEADIQAAKEVFDQVAARHEDARKAGRDSELQLQLDKSEYADRGQASDSVKLLSLIGFVGGGALLAAAFGPQMVSRVRRHRDMGTG